MTAKRARIGAAPEPGFGAGKAAQTPLPLLTGEPFAVLGGERRPGIAAVGVKADRVSCFSPRGAILIKEKGPLWLADTGHHRLLGWRRPPESDRIPADWVIGQADFNTEGRNARGAVAAHTLNVPAAICAVGKGMAVADAWNHRILIWKELPEDNNVPADIVLGQNDFTSAGANRGKTSGAFNNSFHWPYGVAWKENHLFVADAGNRRVLIWRDIPKRNGQPAAVVLGQHDFNCRDENAGGQPGPMSMRWPHGVTLWQGHLCVSDAGNNRIMIWQGIPDDNGAPCDYALGQTDMNCVDHNRSSYRPSADSLNMPYGIDAREDWLLVADTANSRLLGWHIDDLETGAAARALSGQYNFYNKGDNRWQPARDDSFCWPYGLQVTGNTVVISDSGNNRISLWSLPV